MKRMIALLLLLLITANIAGCKDTASISTANFYYCSADPQYHAQASVIQPEQRKIDIPLSDLERIIELYLAGPDSSRFVSPFPAGTTLKNVQLSNNVIEVTLSDEIGTLTGVDLTLACSCLATTLLEISQSESVQIRAETVQIGGKEYIEINSHSQLFLG